MQKRSGGSPLVRLLQVAQVAQVADLRAALVTLVLW